MTTRPAVLGPPHNHLHSLPFPVKNSPDYPTKTPVIFLLFFSSGLQAPPTSKYDPELPVPSSNRSGEQTLLQTHTTKGILNPLQFSTTKQLPNETHLWSSSPASPSPLFPFIFRLFCWRNGTQLPDLQRAFDSSEQQK